MCSFVSDFKLSKKFILNSKKDIDILFKKNKSFFVFPFKVLWIEKQYQEDNVSFKILFSVPKNKIKKAVARNRIKRMMKESFRINKNDLYNELLAKRKNIVFALIYIHDEIIDFSEIEKSVKKINDKMVEYICKKI